MTGGGASLPLLHAAGWRLSGDLLPAWFPSSVRTPEAAIEKRFGAGDVSGADVVPVMGGGAGLAPSESAARVMIEFMGDEPLNHQTHVLCGPA